MRRPPARKKAPRNRLGTHAADGIFYDLAGEILRGELSWDAPLPGERLLGKRFGVSRIIVRQAVHRLAEVGLVRVRQGGATLVLDPAEAADLRVFQLHHQLGSVTARDARELTERQLLQGYATLLLCDVHASPEQRAALGGIVEAYAGGPDRELAAFESRFWRAVARAGGNRIYVLENNWWFRLLAERPAAQHPVFGDATARVSLYREIVRRLIEREDAPRFFLTIVEPLIRTLARPPG